MHPLNPNFIYFWDRQLRYTKSSDLYGGCSFPIVIGTGSFATPKVAIYMVVVAQLVRALDCGSRGRRFETGLPPKLKASLYTGRLFLYYKVTFYLPVIQKPTRFSKPSRFDKIILNQIMIVLPDSVLL